MADLKHRILGRAGQGAVRAGEFRTAQAFEEFVSKPSFGVLLARSAENVPAMARIASDFGDLMVRNLRLAGWADVTRLARQPQRTEDKLERLLQEGMELRDERRRAASADGSAGTRTHTRPKQTRESS